MRYNLISPMKHRARSDGRRLLPSEIDLEIANEILFGYILYMCQSITFNANNKIKSRGDAFPVAADYFPQNPFDAISPDRLAAFPGNHQAKPTGMSTLRRFRTILLPRIGLRWFRPIGGPVAAEYRPPVKNKPFAAENIPPGEDGLDIFLFAQSPRSRKAIIHSYFLRAIRKARRFLPLARRRDSTLRPPLVLMRRRKP
jgi:hypothetical protein